MTEGTGNDNSNHEEPGENAPDEAATPSGWVVTKEAPPPADEPAQTEPRARAKVKKRVAPGPQASKSASRAKQSAGKGTRRPAAPRAATGRKPSGKQTSRNKASGNSGKKAGGKKAGAKAAGKKAGAKAAGKKAGGKKAGGKKAARPAGKKKTARRR